MKLFAALNRLLRIFFVVIRYRLDDIVYALPLPWYLRDYDQVAYAGNLPVEPQKLSQPIIVAGSSQRPELDGLPGWRALPQSFTLRPSVELVIYVRDELQQQ